MTYRNIATLNKQAIESIKNKVGSAMNKAVDDKLAESVRLGIIKRTQLGSGVDPKTKNTVRLKPLAPITKLVRKNEARIFSTSGGGKIVFTANTDEEGISSKSRKIRRESFKSFFGEVRLSSKTTPSKSNLTATGQLLNSITYVKLKIQGTRSYLFTIGDRRGRDMFGVTSKIGNKLLAQYLKEQGRNFFEISKSQRNELTRKIKKRLLIFLK